MSLLLRYLAAVAGLGIVIALPSAFTLAGEKASDDEVESLKKFIAREVKTLRTTDESTQKKVDRLNEVNDAVSKVIGAARQDDRNSIDNAVNAAMLYQQAISATEQSAKALGEQVKIINKVFEAVERKEGDGAVPKGTLTVDDKLALDHAQQTLGASKKEAPKTAERSQQVKKNLGEKGIVLLDDGGDVGRPAGLVLKAGYLPEGTIEGGTASGFVIVVNYDTESARTATLEIIVTGDGSASPKTQPVDVPAGGTKKADFTINISPGGNVSYARYLDPKTEKRVK